MKKIKIMIFILCVIILLVVSVIMGSQRIVTTRYTYSNKKIPKGFDGYKICVISDFHNSKNYKSVIKAVEKEIPNIICITGDLISMRTEDYSNSVKLIEGLEPIAPIYVINGNQEYYHATFLGIKKPNLENVLKDCKVTFMNDRGISLKNGKDIINLTGSDDSPYEDNTGVFLKDVEPFLRKIDSKMDKSVFSMLLIHRPQYFDTYSKYNFDLILSGHLHGGVVGIEKLRSKILIKKVGTDRFCKGVYKNNSSTLIISGGIGTTHNAPRIFNNPEVVMVKLKSK